MSCRFGRLRRGLQIQTIATEDGVAVVRMREGETLPRESLEATVLKGVQVGRAALRVELGDGWRERLRRTIEQIAAARGSEQPVGT